MSPFLSHKRYRTKKKFHLGRSDSFPIGSAQSVHGSSCGSMAQVSLMKEKESLQWQREPTQTKPAAPSLITVSRRLQGEGGGGALKHPGQLYCVYRLLRTNQLCLHTWMETFSCSNVSLNSAICMFPRQHFLLIPFKLFGRLCSRLLAGDSGISAGGGLVLQFSLLSLLHRIHPVSALLSAREQMMTEARLL